MSQETKMVNIQVDGTPLQVPAGTLAIRAAEMVGIHIPRFCDHPLLKPVAACRACLVEIAMPGRDGKVAKMPKPQPACAMACTEGMEIYTQYGSEVARKSQAGVMELLLVNHPLDCPVCDKGGECPLQNQAFSAGRPSTRFEDVKRVYEKPVRLTSEVLLDRDRCVLCQRCVRFGKEIAGDAFLDLQGRGGGSSPVDHHQHMGEQIGTFDAQILGFTDAQDNPSGHATTPADTLCGPTGQAGLLGNMHSGPLSVDQMDVSGRRFSSYFSGNVIQICPVGALTSANYRFRARPFDLMSTPAVTDHDASGAAIRVDARRGVVTRHLAGEDSDVNEEWISDKDRFAYQWQSAPDRLTRPLVRDENGELVVTSWADALERAAGAISAAAAQGPGRVGFLPGGRLTLEDYYTWAKFARVAAQSNLIDGRVRAFTGEETRFLRSHVAGSGRKVTYGDIEKAPQVLLVALEPEDECATLFLRLRKAHLQGTQIATVSSWLTPGARKMGARLLPAAPGAETAVVEAISAGGELREALSADGAVILVGERAGNCPGLLGAVAALAEQTGASLGWVPRRVGERAALEAGAFPGLLPGGRPLAEASARADASVVWQGANLNDAEVGCANKIWRRAAAGELPVLVLGGVDLRDTADPQQAANALAQTQTVIQLEVRRSEVTEKADIVLPVAPPHEKTGTFVNWEGRLRPFGQALASKSVADWKVLNMLAQKMGVNLGCGSVKEILSEYQELSTWDGPRANFEGTTGCESENAAPASAVQNTGENTDGKAVLATWKTLLDAGRCQDAEPYLAGSARVPVARTSAQTAAKFNLKDKVQISGPRGSLTLPLVVTDMPDAVVWLPQCSPGSVVSTTLGAAAGTLVSLEAVEVSK